MQKLAGSCHWQYTMLAVTLEQELRSQAIHSLGRPGGQFFSGEWLLCQVQETSPC